MRSMKLLVAAAILSAFVAGPVLAQGTTGTDAGTTTTKTTTTKSHAKHHAKHHAKKSSKKEAPADTTTK